MKLAEFKKKAGDKFDKYGERFCLYQPFGFLEKNKVKPHNVELDSSKYEIRGVPDISLIFASSAEGILLYDSEKIVRLGPQTGSYGIVKFKEYWYCFFKIGRTGGIYKFKLTNGKAVGFQCVYYGLSRGVHQLDVFQDELYVTDTYNNRIIVLSDFVVAESRYWKSADYREFYPYGKLGIEGRKSSNYKHFNSIYFEGGAAWLVAHNETTKTGISSELIKCSVKDFAVQESIFLKGSNCHNIYKSADHDLFCASMEGQIINTRDYNVIDTCDGLTRGLSVSNDFIVYGVSPIERDRSQRGLGALSLKVLDSKSYEAVGGIDVFAGQIHEIRRVDSLDLAMGLG